MEELSHEHPTPFYVYDELGIRKTAQELLTAFSWNNNFINYFAVKALPNPSILKILKETGMGADCSSLAELILAEKCGFSGNKIMFTSNNTSAEEYQKAAQLGAIINLDDISHIQFLETALDKIPSTICFRYNPGPARAGNEIIGKPSEAKFGLTKEQILEAYKVCKEKGVKEFGLHTMIASNELNMSYFVDTAKMLFDLAKEIQETNNIHIDFINMGGGLGIPYRPDQAPLDLSGLSRKIETLFNNSFGTTGPKLFMECGRYITGPHGYVVTRAIHQKHTYRNYIGVDATMATLMRPGMYGAYHHISVLGKEADTEDHVYDVTGSLCENNDKFAVQRSLPKIDNGDLLVIHDAGAHGHAMGFNYNGKLRAAEILLEPNRTFSLIRRAETLDDYFSTLNL